MTPALAFFASPIGRWAAVGGVALLLSGGLYLTGRDHGHDATEGRWKARMAKAEAKARQIESDGLDIAARLQAQLALEEGKIVYRTRTIRERIPTYVTAEADANCPIPAGAVSVLNAAASGSELPATPSGPVDTPAGVSLSALVDVGAENLGIGHQLRAEVLTWRAWYVEQKQLYDGLRGPQIP